MTGEQLLQQLQQLQTISPEKLKLEVRTRAEDVGRNRETAYNPCYSVRVSKFVDPFADVPIQAEGLVIS